MEHKHHGKSSARFLNADEVLSQLNLTGRETFIDAGCGDGYISKKAVEKYLCDGQVYAVDVYDDAIKKMNDYKNENNLSNLIAVQADISKEIPGINGESVDVILMINVFHGFKASGEMDKVIDELKKLLKANGRIAIIEFKPLDMSFGPPVEIRLSHIELEELFKKHGFKKTYLNVDIGEDIPEGKSHFFVIFDKE
nr:methyltransferase domain-containing protein [uncultured Methanobrevibacter sp.]